MLRRLRNDTPVTLLEIIRIEGGGKGNDSRSRFRDTGLIEAVFPDWEKRRKSLTQTMEMRHLRLVQTLATEGTLTAAGKRLYLSQSALSHQLREIEDEFGILLFDRCRKRMVLTPAGARVLGAADVVQGACVCGAGAERYKQSLGR